MHGQQEQICRPIIERQDFARRFAALKLKSNQKLSKTLTPYLNETRPNVYRHASSFVRL